MELREKFRLFGVQNGIWRRGSPYFDLHEKQLFPNMSLKGKKLLEIGCGDGMSLLWAAMSGADLALGLEPYSDGSTHNKNMEHFFDAAVNKFDLSQAQIIRQTIQSYDGGADLFDIVLMQASINHLDEDSCSNLQRNQASANLYIELFRSIRNYMTINGTIVITDCSSENFFPRMGLKHPFHPQIEWEKHQRPEKWAGLMECSGFSDPVISWLANYRMSYMGVYRIPYFLSFLTRSEFKLQMKATR